MKKVYTYEVKFQVIKARGSYTYWSNRSERYEVYEENEQNILDFWEKQFTEKKKLVSINLVRIHVPA